MARQTVRQSLAENVLKAYMKLRSVREHLHVNRPRLRRRSLLSISSLSTLTDSEPTPEVFDTTYEYSSSSANSASSHHPSSVSDALQLNSELELELSDSLFDPFDLDDEMSLENYVFTFITQLYSKRYIELRDRIPKPDQPYLHHVLSVFKESRPDMFRQQLRMTPWTFDRLLESIIEDPIFYNNSNNPQLPVEQQLAITLYRFGRYGNSSGVQDVAHWAGVGAGYVTLATRRVILALTRPAFRTQHIRLPNAMEKEAAKQWVEDHSCAEWRDGWCLVDGTLIPLYSRPHFFGESYFDRKSRYSLNIQVCLHLT